MTVHYYFVPMETIGMSRAPKYIKHFDNPTGVDCNFSILDYGLIDVAALAADVTLTQHQFLFDQTDVLSIDPRSGANRNLNANATQQEIDALVSYLDNANNFVPMGWATVADTRKSILRGICGVFLFMQRLHGVSWSSPKTWGITLATTWNGLTEQQRQWIRDAATSLGFSAADPGGGVSMRQILKSLADHFGAKPFHLGVGGSL